MASVLYSFTFQGSGKLGLNIHLGRRGDVISDSNPLLIQPHPESPQGAAALVDIPNPALHSIEQENVNGMTLDQVTSKLSDSQRPLTLFFKDISGGFDVGHYIDIFSISQKKWVNAKIMEVGRREDERKVAYHNEKGQIMSKIIDIRVDLYGNFWRFSSDHPLTPPGEPSPPTAPPLPSAPPSTALFLVGAEGVKDDIPITKISDLEETISSNQSNISQLQGGLEQLKAQITVSEDEDEKALTELKTRVEELHEVIKTSGGILKPLSEENKMSMYSGGGKSRGKSRRKYTKKQRRGKSRRKSRRRTTKKKNRKKRTYRR